MTSDARCQDKPIVTADGITCSCGVFFGTGSNENRAAAYLGHRRGGQPVSATEAVFWAEGNQATPVPDDAPPPGTMTIRRLGNNNYPNHKDYDWVLDGVIGYEIKGNTLEVQRDGGAYLIPLHTVYFAHYEEG